MNEQIIKIGLESGMLNYVDHETPRHYFLCANADEECLAKFAELIVRECSKVIRHGGQRKGAFGNEDLRPSEIATMIKEHFGVEE
jgi:hypothetical protein